MVKSKLNKLTFVVCISILILFSFALTSNAIEYKSVSGKDRYITSINIAKETFPNGCDNIVLVSGTGIPDGLAASSLASSLNAPILLTESSNFRSELKAYIKEAKVKNVYMIGGKGTISTQIEDELKNLNLNVKRISGKDRYITAVEIAKEVEKFNKFDKVFIAKNSSDCIDAANVTVISGKYNIPILYSPTNKINENTLQYIKNNSNIKTIYFVGGSFSDSTMKELEKAGKQIITIKGTDRYETNSIANEMLDSKFDNVILINNEIDAISISQLGVRKNAQLVLTLDSLTESQLKLIKNNKIENVYYLSLGKVIGAVKNIINIKTTSSKSEETTIDSSNNINQDKDIIIGGDSKQTSGTIVDINEINPPEKSNNNSNITQTTNSNEIKEFNFEKENVIFYVPHQDDETEYFSQIIENALVTLGEDHVYLVLVTDGSQSNVGKQLDMIKTLNKMFNLDSMENEIEKMFSKARDNEYMAAAKKLGVKEENIIFIDELSIINERFKDGEVSKNISKLKEAMKFYDELFEGNVTHISYSPYFDTHTDHRAIGRALNELYFDTTLSEDSFTSVWLVIRNHSVEPNKYMRLITKNVNNNKILEAAEEYKKEDEKALRLGIGYKSVKGAFDKLIEDAKNNNMKTIVHMPY